MFSVFFRTKILYLFICTAITIGLAGGCSPAQHKVDADKEIYNIIDEKWHDDFGQKSNYKISDTAASPNDIQIQDYLPTTGAISLAKAVAIATANNRTYQSQKEDLYLSALSLTGVRHEFARQWFGTVDVRHTNFDGEEENTIGATAGVTRKRLFGDGILINTGLAIDWVRFLSGDPSTSLASILSGSIEAPLLGNGAGKVAQENLTQSERDVLYQIRSFNRYRKTFVFSIITEYYKVLQQKDRVTNAENNYKMAIESRDRLLMETQAGRRNRFELDQAETRALNAQNDKVAAQQNYEQLLDSFKIELGLNTEADIVLDQNELNTLEEIGIIQPTYTLDDAVETSLLRRLDLANSEDRIVDLTRKTMLAAEGLGTQLDLTATAGVGSKPKTDFTKLQFQRGDYEVGLEADLPFDRKIQRNAYRRALIALTQQQREYDNDMEEIILQVRSSYRTLEELAERYQIQKKNLEVAELRVESMNMLLEAGQAAARDLLESQDALIGAQNGVTAVLVNHAIAKLKFFLDIGILQVKPDGMWEQGKR